MYQPVNCVQLAKLDPIELSIEDPETIFISLGSYCEIAHALRASDLRWTAYPFDWITTIDSERFLKAISEDFKYFLDKECLFISPKGPGFLLNSYYHFEFLHDGDFREPGVMEEFQIKYQRRIDRFRKLDCYKGKVIFIRTAFEYSTTDPHRYYLCADNLEISDDYALKLYDILKARFPKLCFTLVILNNNPKLAIEKEKNLNETLVKFRYNSGVEIQEKKSFFLSL